MFNELLLEQLQIVSGFVPVDLQAAANPGDYVSLRNYERIAIVFFKAVGTAGDDPTLTIVQATNVAGDGAKALNFTDIYTKEGAALNAIEQWTKEEQAAANTYTDLTSAEEQAIWVVEFKAEDLDVDGNFDCIMASVADVGGNAQLGCLMYILGQPKYPATPTLMKSAIVD